MATEPTTDANGRRAQHRLRDMLTTAVGMVDRAANEQRFLVVKSLDGADTMTKKADGTDGALRLPADAKQSLTDGLTETLEKLSAIAQQVQACVVDESAECPPELANSIDELADDLDELADEFQEKASPDQMKSAGAARKANKAAKAAKKGKPFPGAAPPFKSDKDDADNDAGTVAKDAPPGAPPEVKKDPPGEGPGGGTAPSQSGPGTTDNPAVVMKSGRKMARERLAMLQKGHADHTAALDHLNNAVKCMKSGHGAIGAVLKEVGDPPAFGADTKPAETKQPPPAEPQVSPRAAAPDTTGMAKMLSDVAEGAVKQALDGPLASLNAQMESLKTLQKSLGDAAQLGAMRGITGVPRSQPNDAPPPPAPAAKPRQAWPADMSADIKARKAGGGAAPAK